MEPNNHPGLINTIPQELINTIIDHNEDDITTLRVCALVSRCFTTRCQQHIFSNVRLSAAHGPRIVMQLRQILSKSPHFAQFIHTLSIEEFWSPAICTTRNWIHTSKALSAVLSRLTHLRDLTLKGSGIILEWENFPEAFQVAFGTVMKAGGVRRLELSSVKGFPFNYIAIPSLMDLELHSSGVAMQKCATTSSDYQSPVSPLQHVYSRCQWRSFSFEGPQDQLSPLISLIFSPESRIDISNLKNLTVRPTYSGFEVAAMRADWLILSQLVQRVSSSLSDVWISPTICAAGYEGVAQSAIFEPGFRLGHLPQLQVLNIDLQMHLDPYSPEISLSYLFHANVLQNVKQNDLPRLTTINIVCDFAEGDPTESFNKVFWQQLDGLLSKPSLHSVQRVNILYLFNWYQTGDLKPIAWLIQREMGRLMSKGVLRVAGLRGRIQDISPTQAM